MASILRLSVMVTAFSMALYFGGCVSASSQQIMAPEKRVAATTAKRPAPARVNSSAHVYLLRGLMNIFSLGMDDLAQKIERRGITATVHNHTEWQSLSDEIAAKYKAGNHGAIILIGHSLGADAVMFMGEYLGKKGVPVALIVPFDGTGSYSATSNVARVMNLTQRDYAYMKRGPGFHGELANVDVSRDTNIGHISIDKSARLHAMVVNKIVSIVGGRSLATPGEDQAIAKPAAAPTPARGNAAGSEHATPATHAPVAPNAAPRAKPATSGSAADTGPAAEPAPKAAPEAPKAAIVTNAPKPAASPAAPASNTAPAPQAPAAHQKARPHPEQGPI